MYTKKGAPKRGSAKGAKHNIGKNTEAIYEVKLLKNHANVTANLTNFTINGTIVLNGFAHSGNVSAVFITAHKAGYMA